ncbi:hypothetical protein SeLEV6574_g06323 [Synchytrium endobioticum]|uniref:Serine palmitoyltransferase small subunit B n=1 Tax=Synchytrium endobioticum TaxID=286115 RepID=A0A507CP69_9FUNG|nr:hypothetical protein SeLEV6574_g06323 [Synchytrium endobioticum]
MLQGLRDWIRLKNYQYELTFGLYMLEGWEKATFNTVVLLLLTLIVYSAYSQLPHYVPALVRKTVYYMSGDTL